MFLEPNVKLTSNYPVNLGFQIVNKIRQIGGLGDPKIRVHYCVCFGVQEGAGGSP